ncbi:MAG: flavodoxin family protein [Anaerolineales bacterium]
MESIYLHGLDIRPCDACDLCMEQGECVIDDDMRPLYPKLAAADVVILASPVYWFTCHQCHPHLRDDVPLPGQPDHRDRAWLAGAGGRR